MLCKKCGKDLNVGARFCSACGTPVGTEPVMAVNPGIRPQPVNNFYREEKKDHISIAGWIFRPFIMLIPIAGPIVYFIMLFVWAGDRTKEVSFNNWAKAQLIMILILVIIVIIFAAIAYGVLGVSSSVLDNLFY